MDLFDIPAGARWPDEIDRALRSADAIIGVMSPASMASENVKNEWDWAIANSRRLILLLVEPCEIPFHYVSRNYIDLTSDQAGGLTALAIAIESRDAPTQAPGTRLPAPDPPPVGEIEAEPLIVGRERELSQLREALDKSLRGNGQLVLVGGEAGIGKTTLVRAVLREAEKRGCLILTGGCYDLTTTPPYGPWVEIIRNYPASNDLPPLPTQLREGGGMEGIPTQGALFDLVSTFLREVASRQPLILLLEDLHWSDAESLALLRYLGRLLDSHRTLVIATYRDDELTRRHALTQLLPRLVREAKAERVVMRQLDIDAIQDMLRDRYVLLKADEARLATYLERRSEGNPLYVEELLYTMEAEGSLAQGSDGNWIVDELDAVPVPTLIVQLIEDRLDGLDPRAHELLQILAVIGQEVAIDLWSQVSGASETELIAATRQALDARIVAETQGGVSLEFHHALIREALIAGLVSFERQRWHRRVADILIASPHTNPDLVLTHLERANDPRLTAWLIRTGERASARFAWNVAVERYARVVEILELQDTLEQSQLIDVLLALGNAQQRAGTDREQDMLGAANVPAAQATLERAFELARSVNNGRAMGRCAIAFAGHEVAGFAGGRDAVIMLRAALDGLSEKDSRLRSQLLARLSAYEWAYLVAKAQPFSEVPADDIRQRSDEAISMARRIADPLTIANALIQRSSTEGRGDNLDACLDDLNEAIELSRKHGDLMLEFHGLVARRNAFLLQGELDAAAVDLDALVRLAGRLHLPYATWVMLVEQSGEMLSTGQYRQAERILQQAEVTIPGGGVTQTQLIHLHHEREKLDETTSFLQKLEQVNARNRSEEYFLLHALQLVTTVDRGDIDRANQIVHRRQVSEIAAIYEGSFLSNMAYLLRGLTLYVEASVRLKKSDEAQLLYEVLEPYREMNDFASLAGCYSRGAVSQFLGLIATVLDQFEIAEDHFRHAIEMNTQWRYGPATAYTRYHYAEMLHRRANPGDRYHALELLEQALGLAREIGMVRLERLATELQEQLKAEAR